MDTKRLLLDREHLIQMLGRADFYAACPPLAWLRDNALQQYKAYKESEKTNCCGGSWSLMKPIVNGFFNALKTMPAADRECVRKFLTQKKGYVCRPVVLFYRSERTGKALKFQF